MSEALRQTSRLNRYLGLQLRSCKAGALLQPIYLPIFFWHTSCQIQVWSVYPLLFMRHTHHSGIAGTQISSIKHFHLAQHHFTKGRHLPTPQLLRSPMEGRVHTRHTDKSTAAPIAVQGCLRPRSDLSSWDWTSSASMYSKLQFL